LVRGEQEQLARDVSHLRGQHQWKRGSRGVAQIEVDELPAREPRERHDPLLLAERKAIEMLGRHCVIHGDTPANEVRAQRRDRLDTPVAPAPAFRQERVDRCDEVRRWCWLRGARHGHQKRGGTTRQIDGGSLLGSLYRTDRQLTL
jgi:hypothetical protein